MYSSLPNMAAAEPVQRNVGLPSDAGLNLEVTEGALCGYFSCLEVALYPPI